MYRSRVRLLCVSLILIVANPSYNQQPSAVPSERDPLALVHRFFPFHVGERRIYKLRGRERIGSGEPVRIAPISGSYTVTVTAIQPIGSNVELVELQRKGKSGAYIDCAPDNWDNSSEVDDAYWYVLSSHAVLVSCEHREAMRLALELSRAPNRGVKYDEDGYLLPFRIGRAWGFRPNDPKREDMRYRWYVDEKKNLTTSAGKFSNCYKIAFRTLPDDEERWVCEGVGLAAADYSHHGTTLDYRIELVSVTAAPNSSASTPLQGTNQ